MFKIGDKVWYAQIKSRETWVLCPECFGKKFLTVILGDDSQVTIECVACKRGLLDPEGYVLYWHQSVDVSLVTIEQIEIRPNQIEYGFAGCYKTDESRLFLDKESAEKEAERLSAIHNEEELKRINTKERHNRTWAWHAHYHRDCIRRAEKDLIYHKAKLNAALPKVKEVKE